METISDSDDRAAAGISRPGAASWVQWFARINVAALLFVAIWFRIDRLDHLPGANGDEAWYGVQAEAVLHGEPISWRTPTGNLLNPLFFGPLLALHAIFEPSFGLLRDFGGERTVNARGELLAVRPRVRAANCGDFDAHPRCIAGQYRL